ncbi:uncharacterized protein LOC129716960 [Wyeomyia smithii]|uniref:uncharacterized protein LOC129716960 n=1 Tax=Wyeomyia smithii TaxID=174621 RepID=UPI0024681B5D|nr:uncharacterized protein LOC129716960 [Wyeomyia smithii]
MTKESHSELRALIETCDHHVEGLKFLNQPIDGTASLFVNKLLISCLDPETRKSWERTLKHGDIPDLKVTMTFLKDQCRVLKRCESDRLQATRQTQDKPSPPLSKFANAKIHAETTFPKSNNCQFCGKEHLNFQCTEFPDMAISYRLHRVKQSRVCFKCLRRGHRFTDCPSKSTCSKCKRRHQTLLHIETSNVTESTKPLSESSNPSIQSQPKPNIQPTENSKSDQSYQRQTISSSCSVNVGKAHIPNVLLTAIVNLIDSKGQAIPCTFLDCGAQTNLVSHEMYRKLSLDGESVNIDVLGVSNARFKANRLVTCNSQHLYL